MKKLLLLALLALPLVGKAQLVQSPEYSWRVQICDLTYNASGSLTACPVTVFYQSSVTNNGAFVANVQSNPQTLTVDLVAKKDSTVEFGGTTYTYGQAFGIINAIFTQERAAQLADAAKQAAAQAAAQAAVTTNNAAVTTNNAAPATK